MSSVSYTATGSGYYRVFVDDVEVSKHIAEREALEAGTNEALSNPEATVYYTHDYRVDVMAKIQGVITKSETYISAPTISISGSYNGNTSVATNIVATVTPGSDPSPTVAWSIVSGGTGTFGNSAAASTTFTADSAATYVLRCTVTPSDTSAVYSDTNFVSTTAVTGALFTDTFASGDKSHSENGVYWSGNGAHCTVVADPGNASGYAMEFDYYESQLDLKSGWAEQRFVLCPLGSFLEEVWYKIRVYFPNDVAGGNYLDCGNPSVAPRNVKFLKTWRGDRSDGNDGYTNQYTSWGWGWYPYPFDDPSSNSAGGYAFFGATGIGGSDAYGAPINTGLIDDSTMAGTEVTYIIRIKCDTIGDTSAINASGSGNGNGIEQMWINGSLYYDCQNIQCSPLQGQSYRGFDFGYLWGWWNNYGSGINHHQKWLLREFQVATTDIWGVSA